MKNFRKNQGITLIALVITVIVLLILAGVTIATLTGDNGILTRAQEAKNKTEQAQKEEQNILNSYEDKINEYAGIDWNEVMTNAKAPDEQETTSKNVIGLGTNGRAVNMDLWTYSLDTVTNGYGLNSDVVFQNTEYNPNGTNAETISTAGYQGTETNGKDIIIPQYISVDGGKTYNPVTSLYRTFNNNTNITTMPIIPTTVTNMQNTFENCANLKECIIPNSVENINWCWAGTGIEKVSEIPSSVVYMYGTFCRCDSLIEVDLTIPKNVITLEMTFFECHNLEKVNLVGGEKVENMSQTFVLCQNLLEVSNIPRNVQNMHQTFFKCTNLININNLVIPTSVNDLSETFSECTNLAGTLIINASVSELSQYDGIFNLAAQTDKVLEIKGECSVIDDIIANANNENIIRA